MNSIKGLARRAIFHTHTHSPISVNCCLRVSRVSYARPRLKSAIKMIGGLLFLLLSILLLIPRALFSSLLGFSDPEWEEAEEEVVGKEEKTEKEGKKSKGKKSRQFYYGDEERREEKKEKVRKWPRALVWSPVPILALFSYNELRRLRNPDHPLRHWEITCYRLLPWRTVSRTWGFINNVELPLWARVPFLTWYCRTFGCKVCEAEVEDLTEYRNLSEFFRRALKPGARPICPTTPIVSPADGTILCMGQVENGMVEQVKGVSYSLQAFLGPSSWEARKMVSQEEYATSLLHDPENNCLYTTVIYLAPGDYHRFHSPVDWTVKYRRHFAGELLSVNPRMARWISGLFTLNERAVYFGEWAHGFFSMTAVGATNVGSIRVYQDPELSTNSWKLHKNSWRDQRLYLGMQKGQAFGEFNLGSTIVLLFEAPKHSQISPGLINVQVGRPLCQTSNTNNSRTSSAVG